LRLSASRCGSWLHRILQRSVSRTESLTTSTIVPIPRKPPPTTMVGSIREPVPRRGRRRREPPRTPSRHGVAGRIGSTSGSGKLVSSNSFPRVVRYSAVALSISEQPGDATFDVNLPIWSGRDWNSHAQQ
jgi:hypothetical protein